MPTRTARTTWTGGLQDGTGEVELVSSGVATFDVSFPKRAAEEADGTTSPEELIAAAHSACYSMALSGGIAAAGGTPCAKSRSGAILPRNNLRKTSGAICKVCLSRPSATAAATVPANSSAAIRQVLRQRSCWSHRWSPAC